MLFIFPYVGFIAYLIVGRQLSHDDIFSMRHETRIVRDKFLKKQSRLLKKVAVVEEPSSVAGTFTPHDGADAGDGLVEQ